MQALGLHGGTDAAVFQLRLGGGLTYGAAEAACESRGARLCYGREICPGANISSGPLGSSFVGSHWAPIADAENDWIQIGNKKGRSCWTHNDELREGLHFHCNFTSPDWGKSFERFPFKGTVYCCRGSPCSDTAGWRSGEGACEDERHRERRLCDHLGYTCARYSYKDPRSGRAWCDNGAPVGSEDPPLGARYNHPEEHCCACGGRATSSPGRLAHAALLVPENTPAEHIPSMADLVDRLLACSSTRQCSFYWTMMALFIGRHTVKDFKRAKAQGRMKAWSDLMHNVSDRLMVVRPKELEGLREGDQRLQLFGHPRGPRGRPADHAAVLLLYADSEAYFTSSHVAPFVRHFRCYTEARGMRLVLDPHGARVKQRHLGTLNVTIENEFHVAVRQDGDRALSLAQEAEVADTAGALLGNRGLHEKELAERLPRMEESLALNYAQAFHFGRIWAMQGQLASMEPGAVLIYFDADVTIHPGAWRTLGLAETLMEHGTGRGDEAAHIFIADTWPGTECVNSGFVAVRNTDIGKLFLQRWQEKLFWTGSWDQAALAETVLEFVGAEMFKLSGGTKTYYHQCLHILFPLQNGLFTYQRYCDCWQQALEELVGPYRRRHSLTVGFVDPERLEVNFLPNNLFYDHAFDLKRMHLVPQVGPTHLQPFVIHWAGMALKELLLDAWLDASFGLSADSPGCPEISPPKRSLKGPAVPTRRRKLGLNGTFAWGTRARHIRCCKKLQEHRDKRKWPWDLPEVEWGAVVNWWGCSSYQAVMPEDCEKLLGEPIEYIFE
eukprot:TRINITY_DN65784_c0_g1_i1.p1 TRINITY_DN65784_c0_g1~~TRINITY_DN65784_c0_g1_i1.p1  ORF type:complete len:782 (+),score=92.57 TRINITY_DN65784_c0_g1_i1:150-2495(+)